MTQDDPSRFPEARPWLFAEPPVPHYYGDTVRALMLAAAALMLVGTPFYATDMQGQLPIFVTAALVFVLLAAFTSPRNRAVLIVDTIATGGAMVFFEMWALSSYSSISLSAFALRQSVALLFLFAFYFSGKTVRALVMEGYPEGSEVARPYLDPSPDEDDQIPEDSDEEVGYQRRARQAAHPYQLPEDRSDD